MRRVGLYALFFLSGVSALIYELAWQRLLNLVFGVSTLSVSAVLAAFMGGLALGGLLFGRLADRTSRPLRTYAGLEAAIGATGLLVPPAFALLTGIYGPLYASLQPGAWGGACLRFALGFLILIVPGTFLGATLPIMGRLASRRATGLPATFSFLYAVNTLGAVLGAALTAFVFLQFRGMRQTLWLAAALNFIVAAAAWLGSRSGVATRMADRDRAAAGPEPFTPWPAVHFWPWTALGCAALTGAISMALEVGWARILGILTSNSAYGFGLMLTVLLLGLGSGSLLQCWWCRRRGDPWRRLALCQGLLAGVTLATVPWIRTTPAWLEAWCDGDAVGRIFVGEMALTAAALFLPALLMGLSLPLIVAGGTVDAGSFGAWLGRLYAANTLGGVAGAFLTGFVLIPWLGIHNTFGMIIALTLLVGLIAWGRAAAPVWSWRCLSGALVLAVAVCAWGALPAGQYLKSPVAEPRHLLFYREGNNATVSVVEEPGGTRTILVDGQPVAGTVGTSVIDQKMLAHLPLLLHPAPRRALTVGFGSGGTSYSMALHAIDVDCVEIEKAVPAAADYFQSENQGVLAHPRFHLILDDARSWLRVAPLHYDVIVTDCTNIQYRSNGDLYTVEYFRLLRDRLAGGGVAAAWVPANGIQDDDLQTLLRSFRAVFPHTSVWYMNSLATDFLVVVGTPAVLNIDFQRLRERAQTPAVSRDLEAVGLDDPCRLLYTFLAGEEDLNKYLSAGPLNTDDRPVLSYSTYGATFHPTIAGNLLRLLACRGDVARYVKHPASCETMLRHYAASNDLMLGHIAHLVGTETAALAYYAKSAQLLPDDARLRLLVQATYLGLQQQQPDVPPAAQSSNLAAPPIHLAGPAATLASRADHQARPAE